MCMQNTGCVITAREVPEAERLDFLPHHFGQRMLQLERNVYAQLGHLCEQYHGGYWHFYTLSNGGCYLAPAGDHYHLLQPANQFEATVSADAAGIIATLYALGSLAFNYQDEAIFTERYHQLRDFAHSHAESKAIFRAID